MLTLSLTPAQSTVTLCCCHAFPRSPRMGDRDGNLMVQTSRLPISDPYMWQQNDRHIRPMQLITGNSNLYHRNNNNIHLKGLKALEAFHSGREYMDISHLFQELISASPKNDTCILVTTGGPVMWSGFNNSVVTQT